MTKNSEINGTANRKILDYTFLYNPDVDYPPITKEQLLESAWSRVGRNIGNAFMHFASNKERHNVVS